MWISSVFLTRCEVCGGNENLAVYEYHDPKQHPTYLYDGVLCTSCYKDAIKDTYFKLTIKPRDK